MMKFDSCYRLLFHPLFPFAHTTSKVLIFLRNMTPILRYIHSQGVIHRDIKPDNIMLRRRDMCYVLVDFGASHWFASNPPALFSPTISSIGIYSILSLPLSPPPTTYSTGNRNKRRRVCLRRTPKERALSSAPPALFLRRFSMVSGRRNVMCIHSE